MTRALLVVAVLAVSATSAAAEAPRTAVGWLNAALLAGDSATAVLQRICDDREAGPVRARPLANRPDRRPPGWVRQALKPGDGEAVQYRRVELGCGGEVLSRADNWYLPARLTPQMNRTLMETQTPFGAAVRAVGFHRTTLRVDLRSAGGVLRHQAVLIAGDGRPFSVVQETYSAAALERR